MRKRYLFILVAFAAIGAYISGCKIDTTGIPNVQTNPLLIGNWYVKATITVGSLSNDTVTSYTAKDYYTFNKDNTVKVSTSLPDTVQTTHYTYTTTASGQQIVIANGGAASNFTTYTISKLSADSLVMASTIQVVANNQTTYIPLIYKLAHK
jgi:hypothetical protein